MLLPIWTSPKWIDLTDRFTLKPDAWPTHENARSLPPTVLIIYYVHEWTPTVVGMYLTVILKEAFGGIVPL